MNKNDLLKRAEELFFPPVTCIVCGEELTEEAPLGVCGKCLKKLPYNSGATCIKCGRGMPGIGGACLRCRQNVREFTAAASAFHYRAEAAELMLRFKLDGAKYLASFFAVHMADVYFREGWACDAVCYVPMRKRDSFARGYNQAKLLAHTVSGFIGVPVADALRKIKKARRQSALHYSERQENVRGVYEAVKDPAVTGRKVLLIDDILTTGATVSACAAALKAAGAESVYALTACSVPELTLSGAELP